MLSIEYRVLSLESCLLSSGPATRVQVFAATGLAHHNGQHSHEKLTSTSEKHVCRPRNGAYRDLFWSQYMHMHVNMSFSWLGPGGNIIPFALSARHKRVWSVSYEVQTCQSIRQSEMRFGLSSWKASSRGRDCRGACTSGMATQRLRQAASCSNLCRL